MRSSLAWHAQRERIEVAEQRSPVPTSSQGFLKVAVGSKSAVSGTQRAALIRKGNELFNQGNMEIAQRIFVTTRYADGLIRLGQHYWKAGQGLEAFRMFYLAGDNARVAELSERMALVIRRWIEE